MELANIRIQQGFKVGIVSNSVDVVVAGRAADCPWHHLGFMFVDEMLLLPGLSQIKPATTALDARSKRKAPESPALPPPSKAARSHVQKMPLENQRSQPLQGRSGGVRSSSTLLRRKGVTEHSADSPHTEESPKTLVQDGGSQKHDEAIDADLDGSPANTERLEAEAESHIANVQERHSSTLATSSATERILLNRCTKASSRSMYMYADTQVDMEMDAVSEVSAVQEPTDTTGNRSQQPALVQDHAGNTESQHDSQTRLPLAPEDAAAAAAAEPSASHSAELGGVPASMLPTVEHGWRLAWTQQRSAVRMRWMLGVAESSCDEQQGRGDEIEREHVENDEEARE